MIIAYKIKEVKLTKKAENFSVSHLANKELSVSANRVFTVACGDKKAVTCQNALPVDISSSRNAGDGMKACAVGFSGILAAIVSFRNGEIFALCKKRAL